MPIKRSTLSCGWVLIGLISVASILGFSRSSRLPEAEALRIARAYIGERIDWAPSARYDITRDKGFWEVSVTAPQDLPDGTRILSVQINDKGQVTAFM